MPATTRHRDAQRPAAKLPAAGKARSAARRRQPLRRPLDSADWSAGRSGHGEDAVPALPAIYPFDDRAG